MGGAAEGSWCRCGAATHRIKAQVERADGRRAALPNWIVYGRQRGPKATVPAVACGAKRRGVAGADGRRRDGCKNPMRADSTLA